jgi:hypothetical protein
MLQGEWSCMDAAILCRARSSDLALRVDRRARGKAWADARIWTAEYEACLFLLSRK